MLEGDWQERVSNNFIYFKIKGVKHIASKCDL